MCIVFWDYVHQMKLKMEGYDCTVFLCSLFKYEWMMHIYSALLCIAVHPKRFTIMCVWGGGGVSPHPPPVCSMLLDDVCG